MTTLTIFHALAELGVEQVLDDLLNSTEATFERTHLENFFYDHGASSPSEVVDGLLDSNLLQGVGSRYGLSRSGRKVSLLISAINGADIEDVFRRLRDIDDGAHAYELVNHGMTGGFFQSLIDRPGFGALYVCSPWINPTDRDAQKLKYATMLAEKENGVRPAVWVVTLPPEKQTPGTESGLVVFRDLGANIYHHKRLHSKLYIREPGPNGGTLLAVIGSQNLTRAHNLELGIMIRGDDRIVNQLIRHFLELVSISDGE